jgi:dihydrolipoamide dehydrogenase
MIDLIALGGGAGAVAAALRVSQLGGKVILVEHRDVGGACVNRGCIPTKMFLGAADLLYQLKQSEDYGIQLGMADFALARLVEKKKALVAEVSKGTEDVLKTNGVEIIRGSGRIGANNEVTVNDKQLSGRNVLIATGSTPSRPDVKGMDAADVISSEEALDLGDLPKRMLIVDADPVGLELASIFNRFGTSVTLVERGPRILPDEDYETGQRLALAMRRSGITIELASEVKVIRPDKQGLTVSLITGKGEKKVEVDKVIYSHRKPQVDGFNLPNLERKTGGLYVKVDDQMRTNVQGIFAIGDVVGGQYSHVASAQGIVAAECIMGKGSRMNDRILPHGIYTRPEVASVGLTQSEAEKKGIQILVGKIPYAANSRAMTLLNTTGAIKMIAGARHQEILGVHIVGPHATELISEAVLGIQLEATMEDLIRSIKLHPTLSEATVDAARDALGMALYLPKR